MKINFNNIQLNSNSLKHVRDHHAAEVIMWEIYPEVSVVVFDEVEGVCLQLAGEVVMTQTQPPQSQPGVVPAILKLGYVVMTQIEKSHILWKLKGYTFYLHFLRDTSPRMVWLS